MTRLRPRLDPGLLVAALLPLVGILPTLGYGVIDTADGPLHVQRINAMRILLQAGDLWPRWVPWFHLGYGYPIFNFYPPGVFQLGGWLGVFGVPATTAFTLVAALAWVIGSAGMYRLARLALPTLPALAAAALWAYAPSRLFEVWDQGSLPQMMAAALVPWLFAGIVQAARRPGPRAVLGVALPLAGIILSHQPMTFITALFAGPLALAAALWAGRSAGRTILRRVVTVGAGLLLGAGLAAVFLVPLALELRYVRASGGAEDTVDYLRSNFLEPAEIFAQPPPADLTDMRYELPTTLGLAGGLLAVPGLLALARRRQWALLAALVAGLAFALFMLLEVSLPVWLGIPFFRQLRFPERFLRVGAVLLALAGASALLWLPARWRLAGLAVVVAAVVAALPMLYPNQRFLPWGPLSARDEIDFELAQSTWGTTSYDEFDPIWGQRVPLPRSVPEDEEYADWPLRLVVNPVDIARYGSIFQPERVDDSTTRLRVTQPHDVRFQQYYFPGWTATLDGQPVEITPDEEFGLITVRVPEGEHDVRLAYTGTDAQRAGAWITLAALGVCAALGLVGRGRPRPEPSEWLPARVALGLGAGVVAVALVNTLVLAPHTLLARHRSPPDAPVTMQERTDAAFGDAFTLLGFTLDQRAADPGGLFRVTLFWRAQRELDRAYRPVVQLVNLRVTEAWGASEPFFPGGGRTIGYTPDRFASEVHELRVFDTAPPYVARVSVQMLDVETAEPLRLSDGGDRLLLDPRVRITGSDAPVDNRLRVLIGDSVVLACADVQPDADGLAVRAFWHVLRAPTQDYVTFVHGLDDAGELVAQGDAPPIAGDYPTSAWLPEQRLDDAYRLPADPAIAQVALGMYRPENGSRLPAWQDAAPLPEYRVLIPVGGEPCR